MPKVSVIIPVYNVEKYLRECLDSVINQTLKDIEIICVDDGSTDSCPAILDEYAYKDNRIKVIHQGNGGLGHARNVGLKYITADYVFFLDSDDFIDVTTLEKMYNKSTSLNLDICVCGGKNYDTQTGEYRVMDYSINKKYLPDKDVFSSVEVKDSIFHLFVGWVWDKLYKSSLIIDNNLRFPRYKNTEDTSFTYMALILSDRISTIEEPLHVYRSGVSTSMSVNRESEPDAFIKAMSLLKSDLEKRNLYETFKIGYISYFVTFSKWHLDTISEKYRKALYQKVIKFMHSNISEKDNPVFLDEDIARLYKAYIRSFSYESFVRRLEHENSFSQNEIKIFLSYHKKSTILQNNMLVPIHVGRELAKGNRDYAWLEENMIGDNIGDSISAKNPNYCELTAQYWVWKNCETDYVGFMHYRRHLNFNLQKRYDENIWGLSSENYLNEFYIEKYGLDEENLNKVISQCDIITVEQWDVRNAGSKNNYDHYESSDKKLHIEDYDRALNILRKKYPEFEEDIETYNNSYLGYYTNIFIMKQNLFNDYCSWLFDILFELEKQSDISNYDYQEARIYGYISEWLFGIYIYHLKRTSDLKIKELQRTIVDDCDIVQDDENINICFATDNNYIQHLGAAIASLLVNTKTKKAIDIYVLNDGNLTKKNKKKLKEVIKLKDNINLYFLTVDKNVFKDFFIIPDSHFTDTIYYRYIIPSMLNILSKIIYLDCDLIVKGDVEDLWNINLEDKYIAAAQDIIGRENQNRLNLNKKNYYCNSGVLLMDLHKMRKSNIQQELMKCTKEKEGIIYWGDQDVINMVMEGKIKYLDLAWNLQYFYPDSKMDYDKETLNKALENPKIIHFIGHIKPWDLCSKRPNEKEYFKYLKLTPWKSFCYKHALLSFQKNLFRTVFSLVNKGNHKVLTILGIKFKFKSKKLIRRQQGVPEIEYSFAERIFSVKNYDIRKVITVLGLKYKFKSKKLIERKRVENLEKEPAIQNRKI